MPEELQEAWKKLVKEVVLAQEIEIAWSVKPLNTVGRPELISYWDGSDLAYAGVIYIRWLLKQEPLFSSVDSPGTTPLFSNRAWHVTMPTHKARVTPSKGLTTPRSELNGLVVLGRLLDNVVHTLDSSCPVSCI